MATTNGARRRRLEHGHFRVGSTSVRTATVDDAEWTLGDPAVVLLTVLGTA